MEWIIAFLLTLLLLAVLCRGFYKLRRELACLRRHINWTHAESADWFGSLEDMTEDLRRQSTALLDELADVQRESGQQQAVLLDTLTELRDGLEKLSREMALLTAEAPDRDTRMSRAMEEGVNNLLRYAAGKASGVEAGLG